MGALSILATAYMTYTPWGNNYFLQTRQLRLVHWFPGIPWAAMLFCYDETRKWIMRLTSRVDVKTGKYVVGWAENEPLLRYIHAIATDVSTRERRENERKK